MRQKKMLSAVVLSLAAGAAVGAINVTWDTVPGASGYRLYCEPAPLSGGPYTADFEVPAPPVDIESAAPAGVPTECWVTAYDATQESADSNHLRLTNPGPFQVIEMLTPPAQIDFSIIRTQP
jgi:hypothetical protein